MNLFFLQETLAQKFLRGIRYFFYTGTLVAGIVIVLSTRMGKGLSPQIWQYLSTTRSSGAVEDLRPMLATPWGHVIGFFLSYLAIRAFSKRRYYGEIPFGGDWLLVVSTIGGGVLAAYLTHQYL